MKYSYIMGHLSGFEISYFKTCSSFKGEKYPWNNVQLRIPNLAPSRLDFCTVIDIEYQLVVSHSS